MSNAGWIEHVLLTSRCSTYQPMAALHAYLLKKTYDPGHCGVALLIG
jgi:hypothetical protein